MIHATKKLSFTALSIVSALLCTGLAITAAGCTGEESDPVGPAPKVEVPEIQGAVAAEDFCVLADQIRCAGHVGCCEEDAFASVDECLAATSCSDNLGKILASPQIADGTLVYDPDAAGDYLRALASATSACAGHSDEALRPSFLVGSRDVGADCSPVGDDQTNALTCKPGLECALSVEGMTDPPTESVKGTCAAAAAEPPPGTTCGSDEDCSIGACNEGTCTVEELSYCSEEPSEPMGPPPNADPTHLYLNLHGDDSGTSGDVTLTYSKGGKYWRCTITATLSDGQEKVCAVTSTGDTTWNDYFWIAMPGNDGVKVDKVCACSAADTSTNKCTTSIECADTFYDNGADSDWSTDCSIKWTIQGYYCKKIWLDGDGHGKCNEFRISNNNENSTTCVD